MPPRRPAWILLAASALGGCDIFQLNVVEEPVPDAGVVTLRPDPGGPEPGPVERCLGVAASLAFASADEGYLAFEGEADLRDGTWAVRHSPDDAPDTLELAFAPRVTPDTTTWAWKFSSRRLSEPLRAITYPDAIAAPRPDQAFAALEVTSANRTCAGARGAFRIHELAFADGELSLFTATFEQRCGNATAALRGCIHFDRAK